MSDDVPPDELEYRRLVAKGRAEVQAMLDEWRAAGMGDSDIARSLEEDLAAPIPPLSELKELPPITHEEYFALADQQARQSDRYIDLLIATKAARVAARELQKSNLAREAESKQRREHWAKMAKAIWAENPRLSRTAVAAKIALLVGKGKVSANTIRLHLPDPPAEK